MNCSVSVPIPIKRNLSNNSLRYLLEKGEEIKEESSYNLNYSNSSSNPDNPMGATPPEPAMIHKLMLKTKLK